VLASIQRRGDDPVQRREPRRAIGMVSGDATPHFRHRPRACANRAVDERHPSSPASARPMVVCPRPRRRSE